MTTTSTVDFVARLGSSTLFDVSVAAWLVIVVVVVGVVLIIITRLGGFAVSTVKVKDPFSLFECEIRPIDEVRQLAHEAWTELVTRKAALPFDPDNDVVGEVFDSWYALFGEVRSMIRRIPAKSRRSKGNTEKLVKILTSALNEGLRPTLTVWQARYRRWYSEVEDDHAYKGKSPQEIQRHFEDYKAMEADLVDVSRKMAELAESLRLIAVRK